MTAHAGEFDRRQLPGSPYAVCRVAVRSSGLFVYAADRPSADRLARTVSIVWASCPLGDRRALTAYWRRAAVLEQPGGLTVEAFLRAFGYPVDRLPLIVLSPGWHSDRAVMGGDRPAEFLRNDLGCCSTSGLFVRLHAPAFARMTSPVAETLFAHELAHAYQHAVCGMPAGGGDAEADADEIMERWGYPNEALEWWLAAIKGRDPGADHCPGFASREAFVAHFRSRGYSAFERYYARHRPRDVNAEDVPIVASLEWHMLFGEGARRDGRGA